MLDEQNEIKYNNFQFMMQLSKPDAAIVKQKMDQHPQIHPQAGLVVPEQISKPMKGRQPCHIDAEEGF